MREREIVRIFLTRKTQGGRRRKLKSNDENCVLPVHVVDDFEGLGLLLERPEVLPMVLEYGL